MKTLPQLALGDIIEFTKYMVGHLAADGPSSCDEKIGKQAIVVKITPVKSNFSRSDTNTYELRYLTGNVGSLDWIAITHYGALDRWNSYGHKEFIIVKNGHGAPIEGVDYQLTEHEYWKRRWNAFTESLPFGYNGWRNVASYLAHLYLNNESKFHNMLPQLRRKDGTINPDKVAKAFKQLKLEIDAWAYECPKDCPKEFQSCIDSYLRKFNQVDWAAVAHEFKGVKC